MRDGPSQDEYISVGTFVKSNHFPGGIIVKAHLFSRGAFIMTCLFGKVIIVQTTLFNTRTFVHSHLFPGGIIVTTCLCSIVQNHLIPGICGSTDQRRCGSAELPAGDKGGGQTTEGRDDWRPGGILSSVEAMALHPGSLPAKARYKRDD